MKNRKESKGRKTGLYSFSGKIVCGECGNFYGSKVWHSNSKYRQIIWQCNHKFKNKEKCGTPHLYEDDIKEGFIKAFNRLITNKEEILQSYEQIIETLIDTSKLESKETNIINELDIIEGLLRKAVAENAHKAMDQDDYNKRYNQMVDRYKLAQAELSKVEKMKQERKYQKESIINFIRKLKNQEMLLDEFDEDL